MNLKVGDEVIDEFGEICVIDRIDEHGMFVNVTDFRSKSETCIYTEDNVLGKTEDDGNWVESNIENVDKLEPYKKYAVLFTETLNNEYVFGVATWSDVGNEDGAFAWEYKSMGEDWEVQSFYLK